MTDVLVRPSLQQRLQCTLPPRASRGSVVFTPCTTHLAQRYILKPLPAAGGIDVLAKYHCQGLDEPGSLHYIDPELESLTRCVQCNGPRITTIELADPWGSATAYFHDCGHNKPLSLGELFGPEASLY